MIRLNLILLIAIFFRLPSACGAGISIDAGLTPAKDRWIFRTQMRYMVKKNNTKNMNNKMIMNAFPAVLAYGLKSNLTLMIRQIYFSKNVTMAKSKISDSGLGDLFFMAKYKLYRRNTRSYTFGISSTVGIEYPTGSESFSSETWDLSTGIYASYRNGPLAMDVNINYIGNGVIKRKSSAVTPGDEFSLDYAAAYQFKIMGNNNMTLAPVMEISYKYIRPNIQEGINILNTGESFLLISPGIKCTISSFILESLVWIPVTQKQEVYQLQRKIGFLIGTRFMF